MGQPFFDQLPSEAHMKVLEKALKELEDQRNEAR